MLSMQIDRLRSYADLYDGTTKPEMAKELQRPYLAQELREAADTIWVLRDDLQRANAKNEKLRELARTLYMCSRVRCDQCKYEHEDICDFDTEAELRELGVEV